MGLPKNVGSYARHKAEMDRAMVNPVNGVRIVFDSEGKAIRFRQMCYGFRRIVQKNNGGESPYDDLAVLINGKEIVIKEQDFGIVTTEALDGVEEAPVVPTREDFKALAEALENNKAKERQAETRKEMIARLRARWLASPDYNEDEPMHVWHCKQKLKAEGIEPGSPEWTRGIANAPLLEGDDVI